MGLEIQTNKTPGTQSRLTAAPRPAVIGLCILVLTLIELLFMGLVFVALWHNANNAAMHDPAIDAAPMGTWFKNEQTIISFWLACVFFCLSFITFLYQRYFMDHVTVVKKRFRKWEDEGVQLHG